MTSSPIRSKNRCFANFWLEWFWLDGRKSFYGKISPANLLPLFPGISRASSSLNCCDASFTILCSQTICPFWISTRRSQSIRGCIHPSVGLFEAFAFWPSRATYGLWPSIRPCFQFCPFVNLICLACVRCLSDWRLCYSLLDWFVCCCLSSLKCSASLSVHVNFSDCREFGTSNGKLLHRTPFVSMTCQQGPVERAWRGCACWIVDVCRPVINCQIGFPTLMSTRFFYYARVWRTDSP